MLYFYSFYYFVYIYITFRLFYILSGFTAISINLVFDFFHIFNVAAEKKFKTKTLGKATPTMCEDKLLKMDHCAVFPISIFFF